MKNSSLVLIAALTAASPAYAQTPNDTSPENTSDGQDRAIVVKPEPFGEKSGIPLDQVSQSVQVLTVSARMAVKF